MQENWIQDAFDRAELKANWSTLISQIFESFKTYIEQGCPVELVCSVVQDDVAESDMGPMDRMIEQLWEVWKKESGIQ